MTSREKSAEARAGRDVAKSRERSIEFYCDIITTWDLSVGGANRQQACDVKLRSPHKNIAKNLTIPFEIKKFVNRNLEFSHQFLLVA